MLLLFPFRPRKFSFDPKDKKAYLASNKSDDSSSKGKYYFEGRLVTSNDAFSASSSGSLSEASSPLQYLKSVADSDQECSEGHLAFSFDEVTSQPSKSDEEMAWEARWDPRMGPIFALFNQE